MPEEMPTAAPRAKAPDPQTKPLELHKRKCIGLWECCICTEEYNDTSDLAWTKERPYTTRDGVMVCGPCIKRLFTRALGTEFNHEFPARYLTEELDINDVKPLFFWEHNFVTRYRKHRAEYERELRDLDDATLDAIVPEGVVRGRDFQRCNGCKTSIVLRDGCNHMTCTKCGHNFCYICGKDATEDSGHWFPGGCPRWGQPGEQNAMFDGVVVDVWAWEVLTQTTTAAMRTLMQRLLMLEDDAIARAGPLTAEERAFILSAMFCYQPHHAVTER
jgi:hypothetical protein